jgi:RNA polymerase sigma-70 factor (ECF subfamily)
MEQCCNLEESAGGFYEELKAYIFMRTRSVSDSEDLVQEVMLVLLNAYAQGKEIKNMRAWLYQVTKNLLLNYFREQKKRFSDEMEYDLEVSEDEFDLILADYIFPMIGLLESPYRETLELIEVENKTIKETSEILKTSVSSIKMRIKRGREKLKDLIYSCCDVNVDSHGMVTSCQIKKECLVLYDLKKK